jgi:hypothetical protein
MPVNRSGTAAERSNNSSSPVADPAAQRLLACSTSQWDPGIPIYLVPVFFLETIKQATPDNWIKVAVFMEKIFGALITPTIEKARSGNRPIGRALG